MMHVSYNNNTGNQPLGTVDASASASLGSSDESTIDSMRVIRKTSLLGSSASLNKLDALSINSRWNDSASSLCFHNGGSERDGQRQKLYDEAKMDRRIKKDIKNRRLTRARSSDSFLEAKVETNRRKVRSYLSFGNKSELSLLSQSPSPSRASSACGLLDIGKPKFMCSPNETFDVKINMDDATVIQRKHSAASAGRAMLSR